jgi:hypothetical protein
LLEDEVILDAHDGDSELREIVVSLCVMHCDCELVVYRAVQLDAQLEVRTVEIEDVAVYGVLAAELQTE